MAELGKNISCKKNVSENPTHSVSATSQYPKEVDYLELLGRRIDDSVFSDKLKLLFILLSEPSF